MRIVVFSDLYPPLFLGGYEIGAALVVEELKRRGHEVLVLTSRDYYLQQDDGFRHARHPSDAPPFLDTGLCVFGSLPRLLRTKPLPFILRTAASLLARRRYRQAVAAFRPERVLLFNPLAVVLPVMHDLANLAREAGAEVHAYISDDWLAKWPAVHPLLRPLDRLRKARGLAPRLASAALSSVLSWIGWAPSRLPRIDRFSFCSNSLRRLSLGTTWKAAAQDVVPWGLADLEQMPEPPPGHFHGAAPLTLLFAGQLQDQKGLTVLLRAVACCRREHSLAVLGDDTTPYAQDCKRLAAELNLTPRVRFLGKKTHAETLTLLGKLGHVLVVPSIWEEPFGLVVVEGMALGLPVVASNRGGPAEVIHHGDTGFLFEWGQATELAAVLDQLEEDRELCERVGARGRKSVRQEYTIERMVDRLLGEIPPIWCDAGPGEKDETTAATAFCSLDRGVENARPPEPAPCPRQAALSAEPNYAPSATG